MVNFSKARLYSLSNAVRSILSCPIATRVKNKICLYTDTTCLPDLGELKVLFEIVIVDNGVEGVAFRCDTGVPGVPGRPGVPDRAGMAGVPGVASSWLGRLPEPTGVLPDGVAKPGVPVILAGVLVSIPATRSDFCFLSIRIARRALIKSFSPTPFVTLCMRGERSIGS